MTFNKAAKPTLALLVKLGSLVVHYQEMLSSAGHEFDMKAIKTLEQDEEIKAWFGAMNSSAMLPVKRLLPRLDLHSFVGGPDEVICRQCGTSHV